MNFFSNLFTPSKNTNYLFNTIEKLNELSPEEIVLYNDKINPDIWEKSGYNDSVAMDVLGKDRFRALMFGIRHSNKPPEKRLEMWNSQEDFKRTERTMRTAPSTRNYATPGGREKDSELLERLQELKRKGGKKRKSIRHKSSKKSKSIRCKSIRCKSKRHKSSKKRKTIRKKIIF
jgi:hypothetical protein